MLSNLSHPEVWHLALMFVSEIHRIHIVSIYDMRHILKPATTVNFTEDHLGINAAGDNVFLNFGGVAFGVFKH